MSSERRADFKRSKERSDRKYESQGTIIKSTGLGGPNEGPGIRVQSLPRTVNETSKNNAEREQKCTALWVLALKRATLAQSGYLRDIAEPGENGWQHMRRVLHMQLPYIVPDVPYVVVVAY